jgi:hypothetical protein
MSINYTGAILQKLEEAVEKNPNMTIGEVLFQFLHKPQLKGKHYFYATNEEIYTSLEKFCKHGTEIETTFTEE